MPKDSSYQDTKTDRSYSKEGDSELELHPVVYSDDSIFLYTAIRS